MENRVQNNTPLGAEEPAGLGRRAVAAGKESVGVGKRAGRPGKKFQGYK